MGNATTSVDDSDFNPTLFVSDETTLDEVKNIR